MNTVAVDAYAIISVLYAPLLIVCYVVVAVHDAGVFVLSVRCTSQIFTRSLVIPVLIQFSNHVRVTNVKVRYSPPMAYPKDHTQTRPKPDQTKTRPKTKTRSLSVPARLRELTFRRTTPHQGDVLMRRRIVGKFHKLFQPYSKQRRLQRPMEMYTYSRCVIV